MPLAYSRTRLMIKDTESKKKIESEKVTKLHETINPQSKTAKFIPTSASDVSKTSSNGPSLSKNKQSDQIELKLKTDTKSPEKEFFKKQVSKNTFKSLKGERNSNSLYLAVYKLIRYLYTLIKNFPKEYKYTLGDDILKLAWATLDCIVTANAFPNSQKKDYILKASITFDKLKFRLRLAHEIKIVSTKQEAFLIEQGVQIDKMLKGWFRWAKKGFFKKSFYVE